jgi:hypothetical protein
LNTVILDRVQRGQQRRFIRNDLSTLFPVVGRSLPLRFGRYYKYESLNVLRLYKTGKYQLCSLIGMAGIQKSQILLKNSSHIESLHRFVFEACAL